MPAKSKAQRRAMAIAKKVKEGKATAIPGSPSAEMAKSMTKTQLTDFAASPEKGLPTHTPKRRKKSPTPRRKKV